MLSNIMQVLPIFEIVIILSAVIIALRTLRENSRVRRVEVLGRVFEYYSSPEVREARKVIRDNKLSINFEEITKDQLYHIEVVLLSLSQIGFFIRLGIFNRNEKEVLFHTYGESILSVWSYLDKYVESFRSKTGRHDSWCNAELLANEAKSWRKK